MSTLAKEACLPADGSNPKPLSADESQQLLAQLDDWTIEGSTICRKVSTNSFVKGVELIQKITPLAEEAGHHPDITLTYPTLTIALTTHSADALTKADFVMAARIDEACFS